MSAHALLTGAKQTSRQQPFVQRDMAALIKGADCGGKLLATVLTLIDAGARAFALHLGRVADDTAMRTDRTIRPALRLEMPPGGFFVVENRVCQIDDHAAPQRCPISTLPRQGPSSA